MAPFRDRTHAGRVLAGRLLGHDLRSPVVLGLPRGGVPVAAEVATALGVPLEVYVARKIGAPGHEELGIGAIAEGLDEPVLTASSRSLGLRPSDLDALASRVRAEVARRVDRYRAGRPLPELADRDVVVVDDGLATGVTAEAALRALRQRRPRWLVLAAPVCAHDTAARLAGMADDLVCVEEPLDFIAVGEWYEDFHQVADEEVMRLLERHASVLYPRPARPRPSARIGLKLGEAGRMTLVL
jgi:putative phosphoribosyl transferase